MMSKPASTIHKAFAALPTREKIRLVQDLWDQIASENPDDLPLTDSQKLLLDRRMEAHADDPSAVSTWDELRGKLLERLPKP